MSTNELPQLPACETPRGTLVHQPWRAGQYRFLGVGRIEATLSAASICESLHTDELWVFSPALQADGRVQLAPRSDSRDPLAREPSWGPLSPFARGDTIVHLKSQGMHRFIGVGRIEATLEVVCVYEAIAKRDLWVRPPDTMFDGRFQRLESNGELRG